MNTNRGVIVLVILVIAGVVFWFILPFVQSWTLPTASGGIQGPWVVRPHVATHAGAAVALACLTVLIAARPWRSTSKQDERIRSAHHDPRQGSLMMGLLSILVALLLLPNAFFGSK